MYRLLVGKPLEKCPLEDQKGEKRITLQWIVGN
jgi:hypothetical protein